MRDLRTRTLIVAFVAASLGAGCAEDDAASKGGLFGFNAGGAVKGKLKELAGDLSAVGGKAKVSLIVGTQQVPASVDVQGRRFVFKDLPAGPKTLVVEKEGKRMTMRLGKSESDPSRQTSVIPDTRVSRETFDLGRVQVSADGRGLEPEHNPLAEVVDTDGDGTPDYFDDDIDGDGNGNTDDADPWGADNADLTWGEGCYPAWDQDGNGIHDWEEGTGDWAFEGSEMTLCAADDLSCWTALYCQSFGADPMCTGAAQPVAAGASCGSALECLGACADDTCVDTCLAPLDEAEVSKLVALADCAQYCEDDACLVQWCGSELTMCDGGSR